jgi:hypothetical protein
MYPAKESVTVTTILAQADAEGQPSKAACKKAWSETFKTLHKQFV